MKKIAAILCMMVIMSANIFAQDTLPKRPFQFTFIPPIGTNGMESGEYINNVSFNWIAGYNGGVDGLEWGSFLNLTKYYVKGFQGAGFANINAGWMKGFQAAGFANINVDSSQGFQAAGYLNYAGEKVNGVQMSGFANMALADMQGFQAAGFANVTAGDHNGTQMAGFANIATGEVNGSQISGFLNVARKVKGFQLGFINIADTVEGTSIGFLNLVRNGYHTLEINTTENLFTTASAKIGTHSFYSIFTAGIHPDEEFRWAVGYGIGTYVPFSQRVGMNFDLIGYHINENGYWTVTLNELYKFNANFNVKLAKRFTITAGPSLNVMVSDYYHSDTQSVGSAFPPYHFYNENVGSVNVKMWTGFNAGIRF